MNVDIPEFETTIPFVVIFPVAETLPFSFIVNISLWAKFLKLNPPVPVLPLWKYEVPLSPK